MQTRLASAALLLLLACVNLAVITAQVSSECSVGYYYDYYIDGPQCVRGYYDVDAPPALVAICKDGLKSVAVDKNYVLQCCPDWCQVTIGDTDPIQHRIKEPQCSNCPVVRNVGLDCNEIICFSKNSILEETGCGVMVENYKCDARPVPPSPPPGPPGPPPSCISLLSTRVTNNG